MAEALTPPPYPLPPPPSLPQSPHPARQPSQLLLPCPCPWLPLGSSRQAPTCRPPMPRMHSTLHFRSPRSPSLGTTSPQCSPNAPPTWARTPTSPKTNYFSCSSPDRSPNCPAPSNFLPPKAEATRQPDWCSRLAPILALLTKVRKRPTSRARIRI